MAALSTPSWRGGGDNMAALLAGGGAALGLLRGALSLTHPASQSADACAVYMDDMVTPVLTVPLSSASFLRPNSNKAFFGLTASTGAVWQAVDIVSWNATAY